ncbi:hypothetical protein LPJ53_003698 [Coemansia erecta]|uniref:Uncharacterized protein n=1 Tax=Coemansia erecta TaxID=147472 RepID=A0A9W7XVQ8_9FUNG|nr:hypothetical protein LPJ53_003698 [Coemansia erecta]
MTAPSNLQTAVVKLALSGDTLVLRGAQRGNQAPAERTLTLSFISAPRLASAKHGSPDAPYAYAAREFLRRRVAGKRVHFHVRHSTDTREFGSVLLDSTDMAELLVREGWAQVTQQARARLDRGAIRAKEEEVDVRRLVDAELFARAGKRGMWAAAPADKRPRLLVFEGDAVAFVRAWAGREVKATVEHVRDAATLRLAVHLPEAHQTLTLQLAGLRAPSTLPDAREPFADEARFQAEAKLLHQDVHVTFAAAAAPASGVFVGEVRHPAGNIAEWLVSAGYARVNDATAAYVGGGPARLRELEQGARERRVKIWHDYVPQQQQRQQEQLQGKEGQGGRAFDAAVARVISGDLLVVRRSGSDEEQEVQLASVRQPRADGDTAGYAEQAREHLRRHLIGKTARVTVDYARAASDTQRARTCATVRLGAEDVGERLVRQGLATVVRHRKDDTDRSSNYDALLLASALALEQRRGVHSGKPQAAGAKPVDASESAVRARSFLTHMQRSGRMACVVDHVLGGARVRLVVPKDNVRLTLVLAGVRCPRAPHRGAAAAAAAAGEGGEPWGKEALALANAVALQRNAEFEVESVDKAGAFVGALWLAKDRSLADELLAAGLAQVHKASAEHSPHAARLLAAEERARRAKKGLWADAPAAAASAAAAAQSSPAAAAPAPAAAKTVESAPRFEFIDVAVSDVAPGSPGVLHVQMAQKAKVAALEQLMADLALTPSTPATTAAQTFVPRAGQLVRAQYSVGNEWHRARIVSVSAARDTCDVAYVDFGNTESVPLARIRPLEDALAKPAPFAQQARLAFVRLPSEGPTDDGAAAGAGTAGFAADYCVEALECVRGLVEGRELVANVEARVGGVMYVTLYDPALGRPIFGKSVNAEVARAGFAVPLRDEAARCNARALADVTEIVEVARAEHRGMWEYGDVTAED